MQALWGIIFWVSHSFALCGFATLDFWIKSPSGILDRFFPTPDTRYPIPDTRYPIPDTRWLMADAFAPTGPHPIAQGCEAALGLQRKGHPALKGQHPPAAIAAPQIPEVSSLSPQASRPPSRHPPPDTRDKTLRFQVSAFHFFSPPSAVWPILAIYRS